jgi:hypothetical protein
MTSDGMRVSFIKNSIEQSPVGEEAMTPLKQRMKKMRDSSTSQLYSSGKMGVKMSLPFIS